jgi:tetratricopeptide (TPR) repeat protein
MNRKLTLFVAAAAVILLALASSSCEKLRARDQLNKGVTAYRNARYPEAVERFKQAVELDPTFATARLYLATAYMVQYIPGAESPENLRMAQAAHDQFMKVLEQSPGNTVALSSIALLYFNQKKLDEAEAWYKKLIEVDPKNKEAHYTMGVIAWTKSFQPRMEVRAKLGMKPEDPGPIKDRKAREELREKNLPIIEEGITHLNKALEIDNEYDDAMAYLNLLYRERADLADTVAEYKEDTDLADEWVQKTLETKKIKASRMPTSGLTTEGQ